MNQRLFALLCATLAFFPSISHADTGNAAPNCTVNALGDSSQAYDLAKFRGKVVYVDFWASWCGPCAKSFPFLNELSNRLGDQGLQIIGINLDENINDAKNFLNQYPANFSTAVDNAGQCAQRFGVQAMPSSYVVDRKGVIRHVHLGFRSDEAAQLQTVVQQLLAEPASP